MDGLTVFGIITALILVLACYALRTQTYWRATWAMNAERRWIAPRRARVMTAGLGGLPIDDVYRIERECRARAEQAGRDADNAKGTRAEPIHRDREAQLRRLAKLAAFVARLLYARESPDTDPDPPKRPAKAQRVRNATWDQVEPDNVRPIRG
jgi:hypothetical protein